MKKLLYQFEQNFLLTDKNANYTDGGCEYADAYARNTESADVFYRVEDDEDLEKIALKFNCPPSVIIKDNALSKPIKRGNLLYIERGKYPLYRIKLSDDLNALCSLSKRTVSELLNLNKVDYFYPYQLIRLDK